MLINISNRITITDPTDDMSSWIEKELVIPNPEYAKKARMGFWVGNTPKTLRLYETRGKDVFVLPYGTLTMFPLNLVKDATWERNFRQNPWNIDYHADIPLYDYQKEAVEQMFKAKMGILQAPAGSGKGLPLSAKVYTPDGYKRNGDLVVGDKVLTSYGTWAEVTNIFDRGRQNCYRITFTDDASVVCDSDHLWTIRKPDASKKWFTVSAAELARMKLKSGAKNSYEIPITEPVNFKSRQVTIDPWLMGALLGDGGFTRDTISFTNSEKDVVERVNNLLNGSLTPHGDTGIDFNIRDDAKTKYRLVDYGLFGKHSDQKFIPNDYKYNSVGVRLSLLQGLIDTDGTISGNNVTLTSTSRKLVEDLLEIVQSLGGTGRISVRHTKYTYNNEVRQGKESYRLSLKLYKFEPFSSNKHRSEYKHRTKYNTAYRRIKSIEAIPPQVTRCISVSSSNQLYLTDGFVATHNTQMGIALIVKHQRRALWLCHTLDLVKQSYERAKLYIDESLLGMISEGEVHTGTGITFATVQTMQRMDLTPFRNYWDVVLTDECHRVAGSPTTITMYQKVLNHLAARHKYGLSATVHRSDGMIQATYSLIGKVSYAVPEEAVADKIMKVGIRPVQTPTEMSLEAMNSDGTINYSKLINYLCGDEERNRLIVSQLEDRPSLILSDRLEHLSTLISMLPEEMRKQSVMVSGKMTSKKGKIARENAITQMRHGTKKYLFATFSLAKEGLDIPCLERLIMTTPQSDYAVVTQAIGRIARTCDGKDAPIAVDLVDNIGFCVRKYKKRCSIYRKNNCYWEGS